MNSTNSGPTILHITHYKAGSQWIRRILRKAAPELSITPRADRSQFLVDPIAAGSVYPALYVTKQELESIDLPAGTTRFIVLRDLRDTLISAYYSVKKSHTEFEAERMRDLRVRLNQIPEAEGMGLMLDRWLPGSAAIQASWIESGEPFLRYEELLDNDMEILERTLIDECGLEVERPALRRAIRSSRFERLTRGRKRGDEDTGAHQRKGVAGDWRNHFDEQLTALFKERYGELLIASGYESNNDW